MNSNIELIEPKEYDFAITRMRDFFRTKSFIETPVQHRLSILAACEDPSTVASFNYAGNLWPLPQTGQMWLEWELLNNPDAPGYYCVTTSFRNEANPIPGRHNLIFPMFEFETHGNLESLRALEEELLGFLGFGAKESFKRVNYDEAMTRYNTKEIRAEQEEKLWKDLGPVVLLEKFPQYTSPFWNMRKEGEYARKIDVILYGIETIGSAERSTDSEEMRFMFYNISDGMYAKMLFAQFGRERVAEELERFLTLPFFPRCGGGIGMTRMIRAMKLARILQ